MSAAAARAFALALLAAGLAGCAFQEPAAAEPSAGVAVALKNPGFETASDPQRPCALGWDCTMHADPKSFRFFHDDRAPSAGKRSFCMEPITGEPWALITQGIHDPAFKGSVVRLSMAVRVEGASGNGAGPWILIQKSDGGKAHQQKLVNGTRGWQRVEVEIAVPSNAQIMEVGATLEGRGRACLDEVRLETVPGTKSSG